jgi:hypothetical protein
MNKSIIFILAIFLFFGNSESFSKNRSKVRAILIVKDTLGTVVYGTPSGKISGRIKACFDCEGKMSLQLIDAQPKWLKLLWDSTKVGWVPTNSVVVGVYTKRPINGKICIFSNSSKNSAVKAELPNTDQFAQILSIRNDWVLVKVRDINNKWVQGWLPPDCQCPEPYTSCT